MPASKLTDAKIKALRPEGGDRLEAWDSGVPGLCLRITKRRRTWVVRYRTADGRQPRMTLGTYPQISLKDARELASGIVGAAQKGGDPAAERQRAAAAAKAEPVKTVDDLMRSYLKAVRDGSWMPRKRRKAESTIRGDEGVYSRHMKATIGHERVENVTPRMVKQLLLAIREQAGLQTNKAWSVGSQAWNYAVRELERVESNPFSKVPKLMAEPSKDRVLTDSEIRSVFRGLRAPRDLRIGDDQDQRVYIGRMNQLATEVLILLGQRLSEVAGMERSEVDLDNAEWTIRTPRTKSKRAPHLVPLSPRAIQLIREAIELSDEQRKRRNLPPSGFVFASPRTNGHLGASALSHAMTNLYRAQKVPEATLHDWRRTTATILTSPRGGSHRRFAVAKLLSHSAEEGARVTGVYDRHEYVDEKRAALMGWQNALNEILAA